MLMRLGGKQYSHIGKKMFADACKKKKNTNTNTLY